MISVYLDSDVIIDALVPRDPFDASIIKVLSLAEGNEVVLFTSATVLINVHYALRKAIGAELALKKLKAFKPLCLILPSTEMVVQMALNSNFSDFEDAVQNFTAEIGRVDYFLTRNCKDYKYSDQKVLTPFEFLELRLSKTGL